VSKNSKWVDHIINTSERVLGPRSSYALVNDPRRLAIILARYKFCAKMLKGKKRLIEVGCGDAFGAPVAAQEVEALVCIDIESKLINGNKERLPDLKNIEFLNLDITREVPPGKFDGGYSLDVLEHISQEFEPMYFQNICNCLKKDAIFIVGVPNISADKYASKPGHSPHVNLKDEDGLRSVFSKFFQNTLIFSMNDEVVHTGFTPMAHYLFALGIGLRE
jgi:SAM-dependent methyltransferase